MNAVALTATVVSPFGDMDVLCQQEGPPIHMGVRGAR